MKSELCKTCIHTKVCMHDKNLVGDVYVAPHPIFGHEYAVKAWNAYLERKEKGFPCDDYLASADVVEVIRCKGCKHFNGDWKTFCDLRPTSENYCGCAERKDDGEIH